MVEEYWVTYWIGSLLADELLFNGKGRKWIQRKASLIIRLIINRSVTGLRSTDLTIPLVISSSLLQ